MCYNDYGLTVSFSYTSFLYISRIAACTFYVYGCFLLGAIMTNLEKYLYQLRRIEEHREKKAEKEIRKIYKELLKELNGFLGNIYATYSEDDMLNYADLAKAGMDARFLEEVEQRINGISPKVSKEIQEVTEQTYAACYDGMRNAVVKAAGNRELLQQAFATVQACTPEVIRAAVNNPVSGLTLKDTLEKHRKEIIYDIKKNIGVGLTNGDRFSTMAKRIAESLDGDYTKAVRIVRTEAHRVRETGFNDAATAIDETLKKGTSGYVMAKTWHTMQDERVRPLKQKRKKYNHVKMDGITIPQDELFKLPSGATCKAPSQTGVAGEDINCRCYLSYDLVLASELTKVQDGKKTIEEATEATEKKEKGFVPAKTIEEAQRYAQDNWADIVSYAGAKNLENVNAVNEALYNLNEKYPIKALSKIKTNGRLKTAGARANWQELEIKTSYINQKKVDSKSFVDLRKENIAALQKQLADAEATGRTDSVYTSYKKKIKKAIKQCEEDLKYTRWSFSSDGKTIQDALQRTITHEYGHIVADQYIGQINGRSANRAFSYGTDNALYQKCRLIRDTYRKAIDNGDCYNISRYGVTDEYEFFAETFTAYEFGYDLPDYITAMLREVLKHE